MRRPSPPKANPGSAPASPPGHPGVGPSAPSLTHVWVRSLRPLGTAFGCLRRASGREIVVRDEVGEQLTSWGKVASIQTRGRASGRSVTAAVGFVEEPDGSLLVAAGQPDADWARNLEADPRCRVSIEDRTMEMTAIPLESAEANSLVVQ